MDKPQTDIPPADIPIGKKSNADNTRENSHQSAKDEVQLADILKPTTLMVALMALVLIILFGWYAYVLKPALNENASMIHFMESHHKDSIEQVSLQKPNLERSNFEQSSSKQLNSMQSGVEQSRVPKNIKEQNLLSAPDALTTTVSNPPNTVERNRISQKKTITNKTAQLSTHTHRKHQQVLKHKVLAQKPANLINQSKCTQAQIALHQCL